MDSLWITGIKSQALHPAAEKWWVFAVHLKRLKSKRHGPNYSLSKGSSCMQITPCLFSKKHQPSQGLCTPIPWNLSAGIGISSCGRSRLAEAKKGGIIILHQPCGEPQGMLIQLIIFEVHDIWVTVLPDSWIQSSTWIDLFLRGRPMTALSYDWALPNMASNLSYYFPFPTSELSTMLRLHCIWVHASQLG